MLFYAFFQNLKRLILIQKFNFAKTLKINVQLRCSINQQLSHLIKSIKIPKKQTKNILDPQSTSIPKTKKK